MGARDGADLHVVWNGVGSYRYFRVASSMTVKCISVGLRPAERARYRRPNFSTMTALRSGTPSEAMTARVTSPKR
jgi:hypothetical protein